MSLRISPHADGKVDGNYFYFKHTLTPIFAWLRAIGGVASVDDYHDVSVALQARPSMELNQRSITAIVPTLGLVVMARKINLHKNVLHVLSI